MSDPITSNTVTTSPRQGNSGVRTVSALVAVMSDSSSRLGRMAAHPIGASLCLALAYIVLCSVYIVFSGRIAASETWSIDQLHEFELLKGLTFVAITGLAYFSFAFLLLKRIALQQQQLAIAREHAEDEVRQLSAHLLRSQDEERLRIGRELHDSTGQELAAVAMNLGLVQQHSSIRDVTVENLLADSQAIIDLCQRELRTLSYRLHPPVLDAVGLVGAVQEYADGFTQRSGIEVTLDANPTLGRLPADTERALFRVVQESLGNVHRHSRSRTATIRITREDANVVLEVVDQGRGMHIRDDGTVPKVGVGLAGMRERVRQLGGRFEIESSERGTTVRAIVPGEAGADEADANPDCG